MSSTQLVAFFDQCRERGAPMVMVTVIETEGSTYAKVGARMLIDDHGNYHGLVSGGCMEGDLVEHAQVVLKSGQARIVTYDLRGDKDELWGLGAGCDGLIRVLLQPITRPMNYEPMRSIARVLQSNEAQTIACVTASEHPDFPIGATLLDNASSTLLSTLRASDREVSSAGPGVTRLSGRIDGYEVSAIQQLLIPIPRILVLGAGADAVPVVEGFISLGWRVVVGDHRESALKRTAFGSAGRLHVSDDDALQVFLRDTLPSAVIIMSHNLQIDLRYLKAVANYDCAYVGVLGPRHRRERLLQALDPLVRPHVEFRLHGPVGMEIGADSPASIALSIVTEVFVTIKKSLSGAVIPAKRSKAYAHYTSNG
jgi:xanthine dehydrogenase accessory factor